MKFIDELSRADLEGKRVLLRTGFDMGKNFGAMEEFRIDAGLPSITYLLENGASLVILNHNGRPEGKVLPELSNAMVAQKLAAILSREVPLIPLGSQSAPAPLAVLENLRFDPREEANDYTFAKELARLGDMYVNDAFSNAHRAHASQVALASLLPHFAGLRVKKELEMLTQARDNPAHPFLLIAGGTKLETKLKMIRLFWDKSEGIMLGGALANAFLHAQGIAIGKSLIEPEFIPQLQSIPLTDTRLHVPVDVRVANNFEGTGGVRISAVGKLRDDDIILDIGPDTETLFDNIIKSAKMIVWNGPMGKFEISAFASGTTHLVSSLLESGARVITGGGETVEFLEEQNVLAKFFFVSTGGGSMLAFLSGEPLPALEALS